jgi:hypothetical protein
MTHVIPETPPEYDDARIIERPDGYYWQSRTGDREFGPFATLLEAIQDMEYRDDGETFEAGDTLEEVEADLGIAEWIDPDTGEPAEENIPRLADR